MTSKLSERKKKMKRKSRERERERRIFHFHRIVTTSKHRSHVFPVSHHRESDRGGNYNGQIVRETDIGEGGVAELLAACAAVIGAKNVKPLR